MTQSVIHENSAVVLLSGGIDSATTLAMAKTNGYSLHAISFDYHQRHIHELAAARSIAKVVGVDQHLVFPLDLSPIGGSALTSNIKVPKNRAEVEMSTHIPITYVPARNTIFLSVALAWAESIGAGSIFIGANAIDYSGYPDCRPEFIEAFQNVANLATRTGIEGSRIIINAPLVHMTKAQIIQEGARLGLDYSITLSCYDPDIHGLACGSCDSCQIRHRGFEDARIPDPTRYTKEFLESIRK
ncbi:MAG: 7-cyano-7-deazaguanine synthase QueC [Candidatus Zixiibacteriota bacterium]